MRILLLRYGLGKQQAEIVSETETHFEIKRIWGNKRAAIKNKTVMLSKRDYRIIEGWGTDENQGWTFERPKS